MREDFAKILVTRPRAGLTRDDRQLQRRREAKRASDPECAPKYESMKTRALLGLGGTKELNEYLTPLKRYLQKQVGRKWDDVYSEICQRMDRRDPIQLHIFQHIDMYVATKVVYINDVPHEYGFRGLVALGNRKGGYMYVDQDGILRYINTYKKHKVTQDPNKIKLGDNEFLECIKGVWYRTKYCMIQVPVSTYGRRSDGNLGYTTVYKEEMKLVSKKQLSSKEKREHGVKQ